VTGPPTVERALAALPAGHRRVVAETVGAAGESAAAIAAVITDEARLEKLIGDLPGEARAAATELAFADVDLWSPPSARPASRVAVELLERHGLALCFETPWSLAYVAPPDLVPALRRVRIRAHARRIPDRSAPGGSGAVCEQLMHDAAAIGATVAHGGIQIKADGDLYAKARPKLAAALGPIGAGLPDLGDRRTDLTLTLLAQIGALRVSSDDLPGRNARRTLRIDGDLPELLGRTFEDRVRRTRVLGRVFGDLELIDPLLDELDGRTVGLDALGTAVIALFDEACKHLGDTSGTPHGVGLGAVQFRLLAGGAVIGCDPDANPVTVTLGPAPPVQPDGPPCVGQADFELVALRPLSPYERAGMALLCEPVAGREHIGRLTRERIHGAVEVLGHRDPELILGRLRALAGALPQNVERGVADWVAETPPRARLRSAIVVDLGESGLADAGLGDRVARALGPLVVERLAANLLAVAADQLTGVAKALRRAGIELEPGLDRVSGAWQEPRGAEDSAIGWWQPLPEHRELAPPPGRLVSGFGRSVGAQPAPADQRGLFARLAELELAFDSFDDDDEDDAEVVEPGELLLDAYESGAPVELQYAAAGGTVVLTGTVDELDGARFKLGDRDGGSRRWRWLKGVQGVRLLDE
jgi:hypothetical protein